MVTCLGELIDQSAKVFDWLTKFTSGSALSVRAEADVAAVWRNQTSGSVGARMRQTRASLTQISGVLDRAAALAGFVVTNAAVETAAGRTRHSIVVLRRAVVDFFAFHGIFYHIDPLALDLHFTIRRRRRRKLRIPTRCAANH